MGDWQYGDIFHVISIFHAFIDLNYIFPYPVPKPCIDPLQDLQIVFKENFASNVLYGGEILQFGELTVLEGWEGGRGIHR